MVDGNALEALKQMGRSPLFDALSKTIQDSLNYIYGDTSSKIKDRDVLRELKEFQVDRKLKNVIQTYMGISLKSVTLYSSVHPNASASLEYSKLGARMYNKNPKTLGMILSNIDNNYDNNAGKYTLSNHDDSYFNLTMSISSSLWAAQNNDGNPLYTSDEISAIILHELGHFDWWITTGFRSFVTLKDASDVVKFIDKEPSLEVITKVIHRLKNSTIDKEWRKVLKYVDNYFSYITKIDTDSKEMIEATQALILVYGHYVSKHLLKDVSSYANVFFTKMKTSVHDVDNERSADEFASRNGAYSALVSALGKVYFSDSKYSTNHTNPWMFSVLGMFSKLMGQFFEIFNFGAEMTSTYDPIVRRLELIVETAKHAFIDPDLPDDVKVFIKDDIRSAEEYIAVYKSDSSRILRRAVLQWLDNTSRFGRILSSPFNRLTKDYTNVQNAIRSLSRHPLYFLAD